LSFFSRNFEVQKVSQTYFKANVKNDRLRRQFDNSVFGSGGFHDAHKEKVFQEKLFFGRFIDF